MVDHQILYDYLPTELAVIINKYLYLENFKLEQCILEHVSFNELMKFLIINNIDGMMTGNSLVYGNSFQCDKPSCDIKSMKIDNNYVEE